MSSKETLNKDMEIKAVVMDGLIPYLHWFSDAPKRKQVDSESTVSIIINARQGKYHGLLGLLDGEPVGLLVYHMTSVDHIAFKVLCGRGQMSRFYMELMKYLDKYGIKTFEFESIHQPELWTRLFPERIKPLRTTYTFNIEGMFNESKSEKRRIEVQTASTVLHDRYGIHGPE